jgi:hypothetical protein
MNRKFLLWFSLLTAGTIPLIAAFLTTVLGLAVFLAGFYLFASYFIYLRYVKKVRPKYPLTPPNLEQDAYFPRTNIACMHVICRSFRQENEL